jgi:hypothetical protein
MVRTLIYLSPRDGLGQLIILGQALPQPVGRIVPGDDDKLVVGANKRRCMSALQLIARTAITPNNR